ncbi:uncharacterized protein LOC123560390 [Mercenaria mercenaria]|uniref:uncharacterized protein LOC123560390 n=1 Tax=Mercenaria mercenaria TaxID=6596 RepID=UPI00234EF675|nr:uncharacterized protein LOC123560390 [Mercenaria mercenaria]
MYNIEYLSIIFGIAVFLLRSQNVSAQRMNIQPSTISVSGGTISSTSAPTITPEVVEMECSPDGIYVALEAIYSMYIKRESTSFAEISVVGNVAKLSPYAPSDIRSKAPTLEGTINTNNALASRLKATFLVSKMDCMDAKTYQCLINYKPMEADTVDTSAEMSLNVNVLPRDLQISAEMTQDYGVQPIQNQSIIDSGEQVEFSCTGYIGSSDSTLIEWFRKIPPSVFFQRYYPTQAGDTIDDGFPTSYQCEYMRTSKLQFTMSSRDTERTAFRCDVATQLTSGAQYRVHSEEFHITPGNNLINGTTKLIAGKVLALLFGFVLISTTIY